MPALRLLPRARIVRRFALALLLIVPPFLQAAEAPVLVQISADPYIGVIGQHRTEVEPDTFAYGSTIVAAFQVGRVYSGGGATNIGWATSNDQGATWTHGFLPGITTSTGGTYDRATDPAVAYSAADDAWLIVSMPLSGSDSSGVGVLVSRSTDDGHTWSMPIPVTLGSGLDKSWIVCDNSTSSPFYGNCYAHWIGSRVAMSRSTDGGLTWEPPQYVSGGGFGQPVVQPNGTVVVPTGQGSSVGVFISRNGGASWSASTLIADVRRHFPAGEIRAHHLMPSAEVDSAGTVYVVWPDCRFHPNCTANDIVMSTSHDGVTWSVVERVPIAPANSPGDYFIPGIGVDPTTGGDQAHLGIAYYYYPNANCTTSTCQLMVGYISSADGGRSWSAPQQLAGPMSLGWLAQTDQGSMVGDYISTSVIQKRAYPVFAVGRAPSGGMLDEAMYTVQGGLAISSTLAMRRTWRVSLPVIKR